MLVKIKYKIDEDSLPHHISDEDYDLILKKYSDITVTMDVSQDVNHMFSINGNLVAYNHVLITNEFGSVMELFKVDEKSTSI
jgi:hypothetical protein